MTPEEKQAEELKRERTYDPLARWLAIQSAIAFAEANTPAEQRRNRPRWHPGSRSWLVADNPLMHAQPSPPTHEQRNR